jgi:tetratricopeptide (TPR) repeat protein
MLSVMDSLPGSEDASPQHNGLPGIDAVLADAEKLIADNLYVDAAEVLTRALSVNGPSVVPLRRLAWVERMQGRDRLALALLEAARDLDSSDLETVCDQVDLLLELRRCRDALTVLAELSEPDRQDQRVRAGLGQVYLAMGFDALAVDAFGDARTLTGWERSLRRRAWWRSGGPLRFLRRRRTPGEDPIRTLSPSGQPAVDGPRELGTVLARAQELVDEERAASPVLARVQQLVDEGRLIDAADVLVRALSPAGRNVVLLRRLAHVERLLGHNHVVLALLNVADGIDDLDLETKADQAQTLVNLRRFRHAITLLTDLPDPARQDRQIRAGLAEVYQAMALPALAVDAYGNKRTLWPWQRRARRRLWWRTGGPLRLVRRRRRRLDNAALREWPADASPLRDEPTDAKALFVRVRDMVDEDRRVGAVLERAQQLVDEDEFAAAANILTKGLATNGPSVELLGRLAWVEWLQGRGQAGLAHFAEARNVDPSNLDMVQEQVRILTDLQLFRDALAVLTELPQPDRRHSDVRAALGLVYQAMGLPALAADAYGDPRTLSKWQRRQRRRGWWRSGGPLRLLLWRPRRFDERVLRSWRTYSRHLRVLDTLCWPSGFDPAEIRSRLDWHLQRWVLLNERWWSTKWWVGRAAQIAAVFLAWFGLLQVARLAGALPVWSAVVAAAFATGVAFALLRVIFFHLANASTWYGILVRGAPTGVALVGGGYAVTRLTWPARGWLDMAGAVLIATAGMALCYFIAMSLPALWRSIGIRRFWQRGPREDILDELLDILDDLTDPSIRNDLERRAGWMSRLERAASTMEKRLPAVLYPSDQATTSWSSERARGAATVRSPRRWMAPGTGLPRSCATKSLSWPPAIWESCAGRDRPVRRWSADRGGRPRSSC